MPVCDVSNQDAVYCTAVEVFLCDVHDRFSLMSKTAHLLHLSSAEVHGGVPLVFQEINNQLLGFAGTEL